jgi:hypothetical protein
VKPSAAQVYGDIDLSVSFDGEGFDFDLDKFTLTEDSWAVAQNIG